MAGCIDELYKFEAGGASLLNDSLRDAGDVEQKTTKRHQRLWGGHRFRSLGARVACPMTEAGIWRLSCAGCESASFVVS